MRSSHARSGGISRSIICSSVRSSSAQRFHVQIATVMFMVASTDREDASEGVGNQRLAPGAQTVPSRVNTQRAPDAPCDIQKSSPAVSPTAAIGPAPARDAPQGGREPNVHELRGTCVSANAAHQNIGSLRVFPCCGFLFVLCRPKTLIGK